MLIATIHFLRTNEADEILKIFKVNSDSYKCTFFPGELRAHYSFRQDKRTVLDYIDTTLRAVVNDDVDPYEQVQISTMIHPRILFHVIDLEKAETYERLWDILTSAFSFPIVKNGLSGNQPTRTNAHSERVSDFRRYYERSPEEDTDS